MPSLLSTGAAAAAAATTTTTTTYPPRPMNNSKTSLKISSTTSVNKQQQPVSKYNPNGSDEEMGLVNSIDNDVGLKISASIDYESKDNNNNNNDDDDDDCDDNFIKKEEEDKYRQTILNQIMSDIGFGRYQRRMLGLCGFGWFADNMWMQGVISILPRVQQQFGIGNSYIGVMMSSMFVGLMVGALFWGPLSDRLGRKVAYQWTLAIAGAFGLVASLSPNFYFICFALFGVGFGVGGNMPVDGKYSIGISNYMLYF